MVLIDGIESVDLENGVLIAYVDIREEWKANHVAIEYMAQTSAALAGARDRAEHPDAPAKPGFLLGTRRLTLDLPSFVVGRRYRIKAVNEFSDGATASFRCEILDGGTVVASAILNAYRPDDITEFLASNSSV